MIIKIQLDFKRQNIYCKIELNRQKIYYKIKNNFPKLNLHKKNKLDFPVIKKKKFFANRTCNNFLHNLFGQSRSAGHSGMKTKSASQQIAATRAR